MAADIEIQAREILRLKQTMHELYSKFTGKTEQEVAEAMDRAASHNQGPLVLADRADNPGSGAPGDSTFVLKALVEKQIGPALFGVMWDPAAFRIAEEAGEGARLHVAWMDRELRRLGVGVDVLDAVGAVGAPAARRGRSAGRGGGGVVRCGAAQNSPRTPKTQLPP